MAMQTKNGTWTSLNSFVKGWGGATHQKKEGEGICLDTSLMLDYQKLQTPALIQI